MSGFRKTLYSLLGCAVLCLFYGGLVAGGLLLQGWALLHVFRFLGAKI
jgi:hypothetical protein